VRELREFREHHDAYRAAGVALAGINADTIEGNRSWSERLRLDYPLLSDRDRSGARALGALRTVGIGTWKIELFRRSTFLVAQDGVVSAVWGKVRVRGHARDVLEKARLLERS
jgi:peroxiredoxin Q/BCP